MSSPARKVALMVAACPEDPSQAVDPRGPDAGKVDGVKPRAEHEEDTLPFVDRAASEASFRALWDPGCLEIHSFRLLALRDRVKYCVKHAFLEEGASCATGNDPGHRR